jgi:glycosyltransferase involved in cell wall biosynthesis
LGRRIQDEQIERVRLLPAQPRESIPGLLASADAAVISLGVTLPGAVPSKIYEAMAAELPILLIADGEAARRVREAHAGLASPPNDVASLKSNFLKLAEDAKLRARLGAAGRHAAETIYHRARIADALDEFLRQLLPS